MPCASTQGSGGGVNIQSALAKGWHHPLTLQKKSMRNHIEISQEQEDEQRGHCIQMSIRQLGRYVSRDIITGQGRTLPKHWRALTLDRQIMYVHGGGKLGSHRCQTTEDASRNDG